MDLFQVAHGWGEGRSPSLKICHTYPTMMKIDTLPKEDPKIYKLHDIPHALYWQQHFFTGNQQLLLYQEIQIYVPI